MKKNEVKRNTEIAFYMETSFHFEVYRNIIAELINRKVHCELVINDLIEANFVNEMLSTLSVMNIPGLGCTLLSAVLATSKKYSCMVTPYYIKGLESISPIHIRAIYGLAKNHWNHAPWNAEYNAILCYSHYTKKSLMLGDKAHIVGNPRFDDWHNQTYSQELPKDLKLESKKPTILYAPTYGSLSSLPYWAEKLGRLHSEYNIVAKLHHGTLYNQTEVKSLKIAKRHLKNIACDSKIAFSLLHHADYVLTDNSGFIFDAINANKKIILLNWEGMDTLLADNRSLSTIDSPEQLVREFLPVAHDMVDLRHYLAEDYSWEKHADPLKHIKTEYCDAFNDGMAGNRAAQVIIDILSA